MTTTIVDGVRFTDMRIDDAMEFWQTVMDTGHLIEGENRAFEREWLKLLAQALKEYLDGRPEIDVRGPLDHFAMHAVLRLASAFVFNDEIGADEPDFKQRQLDDLIKCVGGAGALAEKFDELENEEKENIQ